MEFEDDTPSKYLKLYQLYPGQDFSIAGAGDIITVTVEGEEPMMALNKFTLCRLDGMFGICLDTENNKHHLSATTKVTPFSMG